MLSKMKKKRIRLAAILIIILAMVGFVISRIQVEPADYRVSLNRQITKAEKLVEKADTGNGEGQYAPYTLAVFRAQIAAVRQVAEDGESYYEVLKEAYTELQECMDIFKDSKNENVLEENTLAALAEEKKTEEYEISLSLYRNLKWTLTGEELEKTAPWNLHVREDGPYYSRMLAYMEQFQMEGAVLAFYHDGAFPGTATITASYYPQKVTAYIYELNPADNTLVFVTEGTVKEQQVTFTLDGGGSYMVLADKLEAYADDGQLSSMAKAITEKAEEYDILSAQAVKQTQDKITYLASNEQETDEKKDFAVAGGLGTDGNSFAGGTQPPENKEDHGNRQDGDSVAERSETDKAGQEGTGQTAGSQPSGDSMGSGTGSGSGSGSGGGSGTGSGGGSGSGTGSGGGSGSGTGSGGGSGTGSGTGSGSGTGTGSGSESGGGSGSGTGSGNGTGSGSGSGSGSTTDDEMITVYISIDCYTLTGDGLSNLVDENLAQYVPADGVILSRTAYQCKKGTSVYEVLYNVCRNKGIQMEAEYTPLYSGYYVQGINYLYEFHGGSYSGWLYRVNDVFPNYGCSRYYLEEGDEIIWSYTCMEGDVPGIWM